MNKSAGVFVYLLDVDGKFLLGKVYISCTRQAYEVIIIDILYLQKLYNFIWKSSCYVLLIESYPLAMRFFMFVTFNQKNIARTFPYEVIQLL